MQSIHRPSACPAQRAIEKLFRKQYKGTVTPNWNRLPETPSELEDTTCIYFPLSHIDVAENGCAVTRGGAIPPPSVSLDASLLRKYGELPHRDDGNAAEHVQKAETAAKQTLKVAVRVNNLSMQDLSADQIAMLKTAYRDAFLHCLHFKQWYGAHAGLQTETADATIVTCWLPIPDGIDIIDATHGLRSCVSAGELVEITLQLVPYTSAIKGNLSSELLTVDVTNGPEMQDSRPWASFFFCEPSLELDSSDLSSIRCCHSCEVLWWLFAMLFMLLFAMLSLQEAEHGNGGSRGGLSIPRHLLASSLGSGRERGG